MKKLLPLFIVLVLVGGYFLLTMDRVSWKTVQSSALNLSFLYPVHSRLAADPLKGTIATTIAYDHIPSGLRDWTISSAAKKAVVADMNCAPLRGTGVYLPIDGDKPMQCGVVKSPSGMVTAYIVGLGRPDNGTYYPESIILTFRDSEAAMLTKVAKFPLTEKMANEKVDTFTRLHPQAVIWPPDDNAKILYTDVEKVVTDAVSVPSEEVVAGMEVLRKISETVKATTTK